MNRWKKRETSLNRSITFYYNITLSNILSCGYLNFERNAILPSFQNSNNSSPLDNNLAKQIFLFVVIYNISHVDVTFFQSSPTELQKYQTCQPLQIIYNQYLNSVSLLNCIFLFLFQLAFIWFLAFSSKCHLQYGLLTF